MKPYHEELLKHGQCNSTKFPQNIFFWKLQVIIRPLPYWQQDSLLFSQVLESIHKFIIELHVLQRLYVRGFNKKQRRGRIISNFTKGKTFSSLMTPKYSWNNLTMWSPFLHPPKKAFLSPSVWPRREYIWTLNWKESLLICFENCQGVPCSHRQSRNRMMNTFIIGNITSICKR